MAKNKNTKNTADMVVDYVALIAENASAIENATAKIAAIEDDITAKRLELRTTKIELKKLEKAKVKLEAEKEKFDAIQAEAKKKAEAESVVAKLLSDGMTSDEILDMLKS